MKSFIDFKGTLWVSCKDCMRIDECYKKCDPSKINGFCIKGKLKEEGQEDE